MLATMWGGFWADWELYHKVTFDGPNRLIIVNPGVNNLDIKTDVYSDWKEWVGVSPDNARWPQAIRTIGGDPTVGSLRAGDIYFLVNRWKLIIDVETVRVTGALFSDDFESAYYKNVNTPVFPAQVSQLVQAIETRAALTDEQAQQLEDGYLAILKALTTRKYLALS